MQHILAYPAQVTHSGTHSGINTAWLVMNTLLIKLAWKITGYVKKLCSWQILV